MALLQETPNWFEAAKELLKKNKRMERISLLELAVWKASCLDFDGTRKFHTMQDTVDCWAMDETFDPFEYKRLHQFASEVAVIVHGVCLIL